MKKVLILFLVAVVLLAGVMLYRAETVFEDRQPAPAAEAVPIDLDQQRSLRRFSDALKIPTISHDDRDDFDPAAFRAFHDFLQAAYPRVHQRMERTVINDFSLVYHLPGSDDRLEPVLFPVLFMGHMDVVPVEDITLNEWSHPPFGGTIDDGIIWGRGSIDDKLGVIGLMEAMEHLLEQNIEPARGIYLAFGHDEEVSGKDGAREIARYFESKGIRFDFVMDEGGVVTEGILTATDRPVAIIGVSEKGFVNLRLTVNAPGGHSSQPPEQSAVGILSRAIVRVEDSPFPARLDPIVQTFDAIGAYTAWKTRLIMGNLWLLGPLVEKEMLASKDDAAGIRTTTAATMISGSPKANILPTRATAVINFRILPGETVDSVRQRVIEVIDDERVQVSAEYGNNPSPVSPVDSRGYQLIASTIRAFDESVLVAPYMVRGGTDAKYFYALSPNVYRFMMLTVDSGTIRYIHGIDERVAIDDYLRIIRFYSLLIGRAMKE